MIWQTFYLLANWISIDIIYTSSEIGIDNCSMYYLGKKKCLAIVLEVGIFSPLQKDITFYFNNSLLMCINNTFKNKSTFYLNDLGMTLAVTVATKMKTSNAEFSSKLTCVWGIYWNHQLEHENHEGVDRIDFQYEIHHLKRDGLHCVCPGGAKF